MAEEKWSKNVHPHEGGLRKYGWSEDASDAQRHRALERSVKMDGYAITVDRLDFMRNVADRRDNQRLGSTARSDYEWLRRWERVVEDDDDRERARGTHHEVETFLKSDGTKVRGHLARNPRRRG